MVGAGLRPEETADLVSLTIVWNAPDVKLNVYGANWAPLTEWPGVAGASCMVGEVKCVSYTVEVPKGSEVQIVFAKEGARSDDVALGVVDGPQRFEYSLTTSMQVSQGIVKPTAVAAPKTKPRGGLFTLTGAPAPVNAHGMLIQNGRVVFR